MVYIFIIIDIYINTKWIITDNNKFNFKKYFSSKDR